MAYDGLGEGLGMGFDTLDLARTVVSNSFIRIMKLDKFDPLRNQAARSAISVVSDLANTHTQSQKRVSAECL